MLFEKQEKISASAVNASDYLDDLNQRIYNTTEANECFEDFQKAEYEVTSAESIFELPSNYNSNSFVEVYIDGAETTAYTIIEQSYVYCVELNTSISSGTVVIKCKNFKKNFLQKLIEIVQNNAPVG